jgi:hypothetical protein
MEKIKFEDYKQKITEAIQANLKLNPIDGDDEFSLIEGFFNQPIQSEIAAGNILIGGITVPMVAIVGNKTRRMYFFPLKALLPEIKI